MALPDQVDCEAAKNVLNRLEINNSSVQVICRYLENQGRTDALFKMFENAEISEREYANAVRMVLRSVGPRKMEPFLKFCEVNYRASTQESSEPYRAGLCFVEMAYRYSLKESAETLLVGGKDIQERGGQPGPLFGRIIAEIESLRDKGVIYSRQEALRLLDRWSLQGWPQ